MLGISVVQYYILNHRLSVSQFDNCYLFLYRCETGSWNYTWIRSFTIANPLYIFCSCKHLHRLFSGKLCRTRHGWAMLTKIVVGNIRKRRNYLTNSSNMHNFLVQIKCILTTWYAKLSIVPLLENIFYPTAWIIQNNSCLKRDLEMYQLWFGLKSKHCLLLLIHITNIRALSNPYVTELRSNCTKYSLSHHT